MPRPITTLVPWFGSNRTLARNVGAALSGCSWVGVPFAGGMSELLHLDAPTIVVSDLHCHVINLARVVQDAVKRATLVSLLDQTPCHELALRDAQIECWNFEVHGPDGYPDVGWACSYFIASWMARNGDAGTAREFSSTFSVRWKDGGGDSARRFRSATEALEEWGKVMRRCTFVVEDVFAFLARGHDRPKHGYYLDPPFPGPGDDYRHPFDEAKHRALAERLSAYQHAPIVCRFYDHPLVRELYPEPSWTWNHYEGRRQSNTPGPEVLLTRNLGPAKTTS